MADCNNCGGSNRLLGRPCPRCGNMPAEAAQELLVHQSREAATEKKSTVSPVKDEPKPKKK